MHPYLPFTVVPAAVVIAWFIAPQISMSDPGRYQVPGVQQIVDPSALMQTRVRSDKKPDIRVQAFLPHKRPKPPAPEPVFILQSVVIGEQVRLATISGRNLKQGDLVNGYRVRRITASGVELVRGNSVRRLPMRPLHELPPPAQQADGAL